ncbi:MAG: GtrA family protein [Bacteroidales bacterium]|nr:GtrA family protein [Bacteroidales bacterium]
MKNSSRKLVDLIRISIDLLYPPFRKHMTIQFFRYGMVGASNLVFDWVLYFVIYNFVLQHKMLNLGFITLSSHIASLSIKLPIVLFSGFMLQKYVTFSYSELRGRIQLFRYMIVFLVNLTISYIGLKILVDYFRFYPTPSNMAISILTIGVSYYSQKHYTFKASVTN